MEERKNIYEKLQLCRVELQQMKLKKGGKNKFAGFEYYELADFIPAVNELFLKHKLHSVFNIKDVVDEKTGAVSQVATLKIVNIDNPNEVEGFTSPTAEANLKGCTPIQSLGGVHTYMKRYLYLNALEIVEPDMLDSVTGKNEEEPKPQPKAATENKEKKQPKTVAKQEVKEEIKKISKEQLDIILKQSKEMQQFALKRFEVEKLEDMTLDQANYMIDSLRAKGALQE